MNIKYILIVIVLFLSCPLFGSDIFVYVSLRGDNRLAIFKLDTSNGGLSLVEKFTINGGPTVVSIHPSKKYLYVTQDDAKTISSYIIDPITGKLTYLNAVPAVDVSVNLEFDKTSKFLFSVYYNFNRATINAVNDNGTLNSATIRNFSTGAGSNPHAMITDPSNRFLYVSNKSGDKIQLYPFNATTGDISPSSLIEYTTPAGTGPRHFVFHSKLPLVYFSNELNGSASVYKINQTNGTLTHLQTISTLPPGYAGSNTVADIHITKNEKFLYVSNRGHNSIAAFRIDASSGLLSTINQYATVSTPRAFNIDPAGKFLIAAGQTSANLAIYRIHAETGELTLIGSYMPVGNYPSWVSIVEFEEVITSLPHERNSADTYFIFSPNPCEENSAFTFQLLSTQKLNISIYNSSGHLIKTFAEAAYNQGHHTLLWDGTDDAHVKAPSGMYTALLRGNNISKSIKVVVP